MIYFSGLGAAILIFCTAATCASAQTTSYRANCDNSVVKQGKPGADLGGDAGTPVACDRLVVSKLANGRVFVQFSIPRQGLLGFSGNSGDSKTTGGYVAFPVAQVYIPHTDNKAKPEIAPAEGVCFLAGKADLSAPEKVSCVARLESGTRKRIYQMNAAITGAGQVMPRGAGPALPP